MAKKTSPKTPAGERFTDTDRVKDLVKLMAQNDLTEIELVEGDAKITLRRASAMAAAPAVAAPVYHAPAPAAHAAPTAPGAPSAPAAGPAEDENLIPVKSPMVGTYYSSPNPEAEPYVNVGSTIGEDTVVCIIEAMKVFNEIKAEVAGTITKVLVQNGAAVEYGQPLFLVRRR